MIQLGMLAKDKITGFEGIVTGQAKHLYGCDTYALTPTVGKDGTPRDSFWIDEGRVEIVGPGINPPDVKVEKNGAGENPKPTKSMPRRSVSA